MKKPFRPFVIASSAACAHCGSPYNYLACHGSARHDGTPVGLVFQVVCGKCRASGPVAQTAPEAVKAWEYRAEPCLDEPQPQLPEMEFEEA